MDIWITITIISCIISVILVIVTYYGIFRYMSICNKDCEYYAERYLTLPRVTSKNKVVVSMYIKEDNLAKNLTLKSILDQTVHPDQIIIVSPNDIQVPDFLKKDSIVVKQHTTKKSEAAFMVPLETQKDANTKIIIVTDGVVYGPDFIEVLVEESEKFPESVIFVEGYDASKYVTGKIQKTQNPSLINIEYGVLVKPKMFPKMIDTESSLDSPSAILSANIASNNVATKKVELGEIFHANHSVKDDEKTMIQLHAQHFSL